MKKVADLLVTVAFVCIALLLQLVQSQAQQLRNPVVRERGSIPGKCVKTAEASAASVNPATANEGILDGKFNLGFVGANHSFARLLQTPNPIDGTEFFVRQHYRDFLVRQDPDPPGLAHWMGEITQCGTDAECIDRKRVDVSRAFFFDGNFVNSQFPINPGLSLPQSTTGYDEAFVRQCYLTYLRREPNAPPDVDFSGYDFWLATLRSHGSPTPGEGYNHLIRAFLVSPEYRARFVSPPC